MKTMEAIYKELDSLLSGQKPEEAERFLLSCRRQAKEERAFAEYIAVGNELTGFYRAASRHEEALASAEDVLLLLEELQQEDTEPFALALMNAAAACRDAGLLEDARVNYVRALKILEEKRKWTELARLKTSLALLYFTLDEDTAAQKLLEEAVGIFQQEGEETDSHYSAALAGMGEACFRLGRLEKALSWYEQSLDEVEKRFGRNLSYALLCGNCAAICERLGLKERRESFLRTEAAVRERL